MRPIVFFVRKMPDIPIIFIDDISHKYGRNGRLRNFPIKNYPFVPKTRRIRERQQKYLSF